MHLEEESEFSTNTLLYEGQKPTGEQVRYYIGVSFIRIDRVQYRFYFHEVRMEDNFAKIICVKGSLENFEK